ncbi:hypothetical protein Q7P37_009554 [Cladosporium fusiforme]
MAQCQAWRQPFAAHKKPITRPLGLVQAKDVLAVNGSGFAVSGIVFQPERPPSSVASSTSWRANRDACMICACAEPAVGCASAKCGLISACHSPIKVLLCSTRLLSYSIPHFTSSRLPHLPTPSPPTKPAHRPSTNPMTNFPSRKTPEHVPPPTLPSLPRNGRRAQVMWPRHSARRNKRPTAGSFHGGNSMPKAPFQCVIYPKKPHLCQTPSKQQQYRAVQ